MDSHDDDHDRAPTTPPGGPDALLTATEAAELLRVSTRTLRRWIASGALPAYRVGPRGPIRCRRRDVERLLTPVTDPGGSDDLIDFIENELRGPA